MAKILLLTPFVVMFFYGCGSTSNYEDATNWYYEQCVAHRKYHPGDWLAFQDECHKDCAEHHYDCVEPCIEKGYFIAEHIEAGFYSDGSYYATCDNVYENIHPKRDEYEQTTWQKNRDDCMELTFQNVKLKFKGPFIVKWKKSAKKYFLDCLRERGHKLDSV